MAQSPPVSVTYMLMAEELSLEGFRIFGHDSRVWRASPGRRVMFAVHTPKTGGNLPFFARERPMMEMK